MPFLQEKMESSAIKENFEEDEKAKIIEASRISLFLDSYDDIFSDFDGRSYIKRSLSNDFLSEAKRASMEKGEGVELHLLVQKKDRSNSTEAVIKRRLKDHFKHHADKLRKEKKNIIKRGIKYIIFGTILMLVAAWFAFEFGEGSFWVTFFIIVMEPGGWFLFWEGFDMVLFESKTNKEEFDFYHKMARADISFMGY